MMPEFRAVIDYIVPFASFAEPFFPVLDCSLFEPEPGYKCRVSS